MDATQIAAISTAIAVVVGAIGGWMLKVRTQSDKVNERGDKRADVARQEQIDLIRNRLEIVEKKRDDCQENLAKVNAEVATLGERSRNCEEDRHRLKTEFEATNQRVSTLENLLSTRL